MVDKSPRSNFSRTSLMIPAVALLVGLPASSALPANSPVEVVKINWSDQPYVYPNLPWSAESKKEASKAIKYAQNQVQEELNLLKILGATQVKVTFIKTDTEAYPDWKKYIRQFNQYNLVGLDSKGKRIGVSKLLPEYGPDLAARLIQLERSPCSIPSKPVSGKPLPTCKIAPVDPKVFLRAAFRTFLNNTPDVDFAEAYEFQNQLRVCLANNFEYTINSGILTCQRLKELFAVPKAIPLSKDYTAFSFTITINNAQNTAVMTYKGKNLSNRAPKAIYSRGSLMRFSY
jgi:hypothetical protein